MEEISIYDIYVIMKRNSKLAVSVFLASFLGICFFTLLTPRIYTAASILQFENKESINCASILFKNYITLTLLSTDENNIRVEPIRNTSFVKVSYKDKSEKSALGKMSKLMRICLASNDKFNIQVKVKPYIDEDTRKLTTIIVGFFISAMLSVMTVFFRKYWLGEKNKTRG